MSHKRKDRTGAFRPARPGDSAPERADQASFPDGAPAASLGPDRPAAGASASSALFPRPADDLLAAVARLPELLSAALELKTRHRAGLPREVAALSALLTSERAGLGHDYLQSPAAVAAYLFYFLPWNLYRLGRLATGLAPLLAAADARATVADLGAGPLTTPLALWLALPAWRTRQLDFYCVDRSRRIMAAGRDIFEALTRATDGTPCPWRIHLVHAPLRQALREEMPRPDLLVLGNVLNEFRWQRDVALEEQLDELAQTMLGRLNPGGQALLVEPGNRLGGKLVATFRDAAIRQGFRPLAPCTHDAACPRLDRRRKSWCHFTFKPDGLPQWLTRLTDKAGLSKSSLSVSFVLLGGTAPYEPAAIRVLSESFPLPERGVMARYGCCRQGLVLLETEKSRADCCAPGDLLRLPTPPDAPRDGKSGALIIRTDHPTASTSPSPAASMPGVGRVDIRRPLAKKPARTSSERPAWRQPSERTTGRPSAERAAPQSRRKPDEDARRGRPEQGAFQDLPRWGGGGRKTESGDKRSRTGEIESSGRSRGRSDATRPEPGRGRKPARGQHGTTSGTRFSDERSSPKKGAGRARRQDGFAGDWKERGDERPSRQGGSGGYAARQRDDERGPGGKSGRMRADATSGQGRSAGKRGPERGPERSSERGQARGPERGQARGQARGRDEREQGRGAAGRQERGFRDRHDKRPEGQEREWRRSDDKRSGRGDEPARRSAPREGARQPGAKGTGRRPWEKDEPRRPQDRPRDKGPRDKGPADKRRGPDAPERERKGKGGSRHGDEAKGRGPRSDEAKKRGPRSDEAKNRGPRSDEAKTRGPRRDEAKDRGPREATSSRPGGSRTAPGGRARKKKKRPGGKGEDR